MGHTFKRQPRNDELEGDRKVKNSIKHIADHKKIVEEILIDDDSDYAIDRNELEYFIKKMR